MLKPNRNYVIEEDGSIHEMIFAGDSDWEEKPTTTIQEIRNKVIDEYVNALKPIIDEKIKGWTNSDDLRRWCNNSIDKIAEQLKG